MPSTSIGVFRAHAGRSLLILRNASVAASATSRISEVRRRAPRRGPLPGKKKKHPRAREPSRILQSLGKRGREEEEAGPPAQPPFDLAWERRRRGKTRDPRDQTSGRP